VEELGGPASGAGEECVGEAEEGEEVDGNACDSQYGSNHDEQCVGVPIWWSQMSVHSEAMSPSSSTFFACIFRLLGADGAFWVCMCSECVFGSAPSLCCVVAMAAVLQYGRW